MNLYELSAAELASGLASGDFSAGEVCDAHLERIQQVDGQVKAFLHTLPEQARAHAQEIDRRRAAGEELPPLAGVPVGHKDLLCTRGVPTTCGSRMLESFVPPYDATVVARCREAGLPALGKLNMDEFAMGSSTENSAFQITTNPWDPERVPGGSSGGSAAAVAAGEVPLALGTDTGGSIRQPAALCGIVGMKPTYGRVSRYGVVAYASSLDQVGPFGRTVTDCALLLSVIAGHDPRDATSTTDPVPDYAGELEEGVEGLRAGVPAEMFGEGIAPQVKACVLAAVDKLQELGVECEEVHLPHVDYSLPCYYIIAPAECSSNLARYDGVRYGHRTAEPAEDIYDLFSRTRAEGFGPEVRLRIMLGTYTLSAGYYDAYYLKALRVRTLIKGDFDRAFERCDVLLSPTSPTPAFRIGERADDPMAMKLADICTIPVNLAGLPGMSLPCGFVEGLPVGLQIIGKPFGESAMLRLAYAYEQAEEWTQRKAGG